jgi:hyperosmotically inducible protein
MRRGNKEEAMKTKRAFGVTKSVVFAVLAMALVASAALAAEENTAATAGSTPAQLRLAKQVRHELVMLPFYSVFDNLTFSVEDPGTVILSGHVVRPTLRSGAERVVSRLEGVNKVVNKIEVLPLSGFDDRLRIATYRALFSRPGLDRYALPVNSPIRIIVKNGEITLVGVVARKGDKDLAGIVANGISGAFKVTNELVVEKM